MECNFCNKIFSSKSSLNFHQKTTKYCLKLQGKNEYTNNFICEYCDKKFTTKQQVCIHINLCKTKNKDEKEKEFEEKLKIKEKEFEEKVKEKEFEEKVKEKEFEEKVKEKEFEEKLKIKEKEFEEKLKIKEKEFEKKLKEKENIIYEYKEKNAGLVGQLMTLKEDHETLREIAKQPKNSTTTNNTLNITSCIDFDNINKIKDVIQNDFNINYAINGQKGIARFVKDKLLKDENGNLLYVCTDPSRQIFKYKDNKGEIRKDVEAKKLTDYIVDGGIKKKTVDVANEWYTDDNGDIDMEKFNFMMDTQQSILNLKEDNNSFKKELASITT